MARSPGRARASVLGRYPRFRILPVADGEEALVKVTSEVSVAALDLVMPRRNGIEVIQELRARRPDLAILAFTGHAPPSEAVAAVMAGADHFHEITDLESFEHAIDLTIDRRRLIARRAEQEQRRRRQRKQEVLQHVGAEQVLVA